MVLGEYLKWCGQRKIKYYLFIYLLVVCDFLKSFKWFVYQELSNGFGWGFNQISGCGKLPAGELRWHQLNAPMVVGISSVYQGLRF